MQQNDNIVVYESDVLLGNKAQLPMNFITIGTIENNDVHVYIKQSAYLAIEKLAISNTKRELGSILIGSVSEEMGALHVVVSDCVEAKFTDASASTLTFTHETWDYVHTEHQRLHADKKIVGWQHTHPSYGIFLSSYDTFIQENFFNLPFQIAYVVDPIQGQRGFFQWKDGKIKKLEGFYIYDEVGTPVKPVSQSKHAKHDAVKKYKRMMIMTLCLAVGVAAMLTTALIISNIKNNKTLQQLMAKNNDLQLVINRQLSDIESLKLGPSNQVTSLNGVVFEKYTVVKGDTLSSICKAKGLNYDAYRRILVSINGIKNPNIIMVGQAILIPMTGITK